MKPRRWVFLPVILTSLVMGAWLDRMLFRVFELPAPEQKSASSEAATDTTIDERKAVALVVRSWTELDSANAAAWIAALPEGQSREAAFGSYAGALAASEPTAAANWAQGITEPELRARVLEQVARAWLKVDPVAARAWLEQAPLPPQSKARALNPKKG